MKDYAHFLARVINTPLLVSDTKLAIVGEKVVAHLLNGTQHSVKYDMDADSSVRRQESSKAPLPEEWAKINVYDTLQARGFGGGLSGNTTYLGLRSEIGSRIAEGYKNILLNIDSFGGEATGLFALTEYIRGQVDSGINIVSFVDGAATSAAYGIAAATKAIYATETSLLGSIGAIIMHVETSKADAEAGRTYNIFRSKPEKALGDSHTPLSAEAKQKIEERLASLDDTFNNDILKSMPNLSLQNILDMRGSEFIAPKAVTLGLANHIVSGVDSALHMATTTFITGKPVLSTNRKEATMSANEEMIAQLAAANTEVTELRVKLASTDALMQAALLQERERVAAILGASKTLKISLDTASAHIAKGYDKDSSLEIMTAIAEGQANATSLQGQPLPGTEAPPTKTDAEDSAASRMSGLRSAVTLAGHKLITGV